MRMVKNKFLGVIICLFELLTGILLLVNPVAYTSIIIIRAGSIIAIAGLINTIKYFTSSKKKASSEQYLAKGLLLIIAGVFCIVKSDWFILTFPMITVIYGIMIGLMGIDDIQLSLDMIRARERNWFIALISAVISIACSAIILTAPFSSTTILWTFTGIVIIVEAIMDFLIIFVKKKEADD